MDLDYWGHLLPYVGTGVGFGLLTGWVVGFFTKKMAKMAAFILGLIFVLIQILVVNRWIEVNWPKVAASAGQFAHQFQGSHSALWAMLLWNFPYAGSFAVGFALGFRKG